MSNQKKFDNRLNDLFADMGEESAPVSSSRETLSGWNWQCDAAGKYTACSFEVEDILGVAPSSFIGELMTKYLLSPQSSKDLSDAIGDGENQTIEIILQYKKQDNALVPIRTHIIRQDSEFGEIIGWKGFSQVIQSDTPLQPSGEASPQSKIQLDTTSEAVSHHFRSGTFGLALEEDQTSSVSSPYSGAGKQSLKINQTVSYPSAPGIEAALAVPVQMANDTTGLLEIIDPSPGREWNQDEQLLVEEIAEQLSLAMENARLFQEEQHRRRIAATLSEIARVIGGSLDLEQIADRLLAQLSDVVEFDGASLQIIEGDQRKSVGRVSKYSANARNSPALDLPISEDPIIRSIVESQNPLVINDVQADPRWNLRPDTQQIRSWMAAPLLRGNEVIGLLVLDHVDPGAFDEETADLMTGIAAQAAVAIHNARLYQQAQSRSTQLQTAAEVSRAASSILDPNPLIQQTVNLIRQRFDLYYVGVFIIDDTGDLTREPGKWAVLRAGTGDAGRIQVERGHKLEIGGISMVGQCIASTQAQVSLQVTTEEQRFINPLLPETRSELALPLISRGLVTGAMTIQSTQPSAFSDDDIAILQTMADQVANALQNASLFDQIQVRAEELAVLNEMSRQLTATVDVKTITRNIYLFTSRLIDTSTFFIALYNAQNDSVNFPFATEDNQEITISGDIKSQGITKYVIEHRAPLLINENTEKWMQNQGLEFVSVGTDDALVAQSWLGVPMLVGDEVIGIINVQHMEPHYYSEQDQDLLTAIASQSAIAFQNAALFIETRQRTEDLAVLNEMSRVLANLLDINMVADTVHEYTSRLMDTTNLFMALFDASTEEITIPLVINENQRIEVPKRKLGNGLSDHVIRSRRYLLLNGDIPGQMEDLGLDVIPLGDDRAPLSWLGVPMMIGDRVIGVIAVQSLTTPHLYQERHRDLLASVASQVAITIQNTRLFDQTRRQLRDLETISSASQTLSSAPLETTSVAEIIARIFIDLMGSQARVTIILRDTETADSMKTYVSMEYIDGQIRSDGDLEQWDFSLAEFPATDKVMSDIEPLIVRKDDPDADSAELAYMKDQEISFLAIIPLAVKGQSIGVIELESSDKSYTLSEEELNLGFTLANQAAISLENARLYVEQRETAEQLREIDTLKSQFLANMSHELRTPLNSIIGFSRVIMKGIDGPVTDLQQQDLSAIYNAGQHLLNMINDILDISKIEAGKMELAFDDIELPSIIESVLSTARGLVKDKPVKLITAIEDDLPIMAADPTRIRQILLNLISNASKFTDEGSITVTARKQIGKEGRGEIYIGVTDTGSGIDTEDQYKLFVPFSQVDGSPTRKVEGTGLGLSITRLLVELHGGEIGVESQLKQGSTFWFTLPLPELIPQNEGSDKLAVMAIDDDPQVIGLYDRYLNSAGFQVIPITKPQEALEHARQIKPFAITLDIMMPDFDGWDLLKTLKTDSQTSEIPVVICSILSEHEKGLELGAADYLTKPILEDDLVTALNKLKQIPNEAESK